MSYSVYKRRIYTGGANKQSVRSTNLNENDLNGLLHEQWLSNNTIDTYLRSLIKTSNSITIHDSDVALLLQGGAAEFLDRNYIHPSEWTNKNLIPTIIRRNEHEGYHWVLLEIDMRERE